MKVQGKNISFSEESKTCESRIDLLKKVFPNTPAEMKKQNYY